VEILMDQLVDVAEGMNSRAELEYTHRILEEGTSADRQLQVWRETNDLRAVVAHLAEEGTYAHPI
jgi:carboxylate-amine ligase